MTSWNDLWRLAASLVLLSVVFCLVGCGKTSPPVADSGPINQLPQDGDSTPESKPATSDSQDPVADDSAIPGETAPADPPSAEAVNAGPHENMESGAAPVAPRAGDKQPTKKQPDDKQPADKQPTKKQPDEKQPDEPAKTARKVPPAPDHVHQPKVLLSDAHRQTCLVAVGDVLPGFELPDLEGNVQKLPELLGEEFTVVVFWSRGNLLGQEQIRRLASEVAGPFADAGVKVVAINSGDTAQQIEPAVPSKSERGFEVLIDQSGSVLASVATDYLPRTYLLDAEGRILWFDLEYSRSSTRELTNALHFFFGNGSESDS